MNKYIVLKEFPWFTKWNIYTENEISLKFNSNISDYPDFFEEYNGEIKNDKEEWIPVVLENIDWSSVINLAEDLKKEIIDWEFHEDNDYNHRFFETALTSIYWEDFFKWYNKNT